MKNNKNIFVQDFKVKIQQSIDIKQNLINIYPEILKSINIVHKALKGKNKILFCGNGGSAADAQHLAAELLIRLRPKINRRSLPAISLAMDTSTLTACGNDYNFREIFSRPLQSLGNKGDILIVISTSGNSENIISVLKESKKKGIKSIGFFGNNGGKAKKFCDINLIVPSKVTARIQECHIFLGHYILESVEKRIFKK